MPRVPWPCSWVLPLDTSVNLSCQLLLFWDMGLGGGWAVTYFSLERIPFFFPHTPQAIWFKSTLFMWEGNFSVFFTYPVFGNGFLFAVKSLHISVLAFIMFYCADKSIIWIFYNMCLSLISIGVNSRWCILSTVTAVILGEGPLALFWYCGLVPPSPLFWPDYIVPFAK